MHQIANELRLTPFIREVVAHPARNKVLTTGRRFGKDRIMFLWMFSDPLVPYGLYWFIAPYYGQAKEIFWPLLKMFARYHGVGGRAVSESELSVTFPNYAKVRIYGADNPDGLTGVGLQKAGFSEFALTKKPEIWTVIVRPMLTQTKGKAFFNSTPRGRNHHHDLHMKGMGATSDQWASWLRYTKDSPFVDPAEVEAAREDMDPILWAQEYEASWDTGSNLACWNFDYDKHVKQLPDNVIPGPGACWIGLDFNIKPMVAEVGCMLGDGTVYYFDEVVIHRNANTHDMAAELRRRYPHINTIYPDPTGGHGDTRSDTSDHRILQEAGFRVLAQPPGKPTQRERMAAWNRKLMDGNGETFLLISPKNKQLISDSLKTERIGDGHIDKKTHDPHAFDAASYAVEYQFPIRYRNVSVRRSA